MTTLSSFIALALLAIAGIIAARFFVEYRRLKRAEFIRAYAWPPGLLDKLEAHYPGFGRKESALVASGLRQFFLAYLNSGQRYVAMPSQVADELWHEFILYTRAYQEFCGKAFGAFLHHTPAVALAPGHTRDNSGLRRVWWHCCKEENLDPRNPTRLPLLFALDAKLKIPNGYVYHPDCEELRRNGQAGGQCGGDFSDSSIDGGTDGFGDGGSGGGDSGGGDGGSCGGGGGD